MSTTTRNEIKEQNTGNCVTMNDAENVVNDQNGEAEGSTPTPGSDNEIILVTTSQQTVKLKKLPSKNKTNGDVRRRGVRKQLKRQRSLDCTIDLTSDSNDSSSSRPGLHSSQRTTSLSNLGSSARSREPVHTPRETKASIRRKQLAHSKSYSREDRGSLYLTPFQRKEQTIRELRRALKESHDKLRVKDQEILDIVSEKDGKLSTFLAGKDEEIHTLRDQVRELEQECSRLREVQDALKDERDCFKLQNKTLELDAKEQEEHKREMYLLMYEKGKRCADFERQDTLEELANQDPKSVPVPELLSKLEQMQEKLSELQSTTRVNRYQDGIVLLPKTDGEATLRCIKDALFHYLTSQSKLAKTQNLSILLGLCAFTDVQRRKIESTLSKTKSKTQMKNS